MCQTLSLTEVGPYGEAYASMMPPLHARGSLFASRVRSSTAVLTPYTLREMGCCASKPGKPVLELCLAHLPNRGDARWKLSDNGAIKNLVQIGVK